MKAVLGLILTLAVILSCTYASNVKVLTKDNFEETLSKHDIVLVEFYAPWCGHCKRLEPEYEVVADTFVGNDSIAITKVDCTVEEELASKNGIRGYPTIKLFKKGKLAADYAGARDSQSIVGWVEEKSLPRVISVEKKEDFDGFMERKSIGKVFAFVSEEDKEILLNFGKLSDELEFDDLLFGFTLNTEISASLGREKSGLEVFVNDEWKKYEGDMNYEKVRDFVFHEAYPKFEHLVLSQDFAARMQRRQLPLITVFTGEKENYSQEDQVAFAKKLSETVKGKAHFAHVEKDEYKDLASGWGASGKVYPTITIIKFGESMGIFAFDETKELTLESATEWIEGCISGKECPTHLKSDPVPENNDGPVKTIVGKTYKEIVNDPTKDVLVKFYSPSCQHCKKMADAYIELGKKYENDETLVVAEIDATTNTHSENERVRGFPTILLFKASDKENPVSFDSGERTVENMSQFLDEHRKVKSEETKEEVKEETKEEVKEEEVQKEGEKVEEEVKKDEL